MSMSSWLMLVALHLGSLAAAVAITAWALRCTRRHLPDRCPQCAYRLLDDGRLQDLTFTGHSHRSTWVPARRRPRPALVRHAPRSDVDVTAEIPGVPR